MITTTKHINVCSSSSSSSSSSCSSSSSSCSSSSSSSCSSSSSSCSSSSSSNVVNDKRKQIKLNKFKNNDIKNNFMWDLSSCLLDNQKRRKHKAAKPYNRHIMRWSCNEDLKEKWQFSQDNPGFLRGLSLLPYGCCRDQKEAWQVSQNNLGFLRGLSLLPYGCRNILKVRPLKITYSSVGSRPNYALKFIRNSGAEKSLQPTSSLFVT
uniref:Uncharacterized protein n=1 Tax=Glossina brevipalpis TaxID=37001 RepID=A0A1A9W1C8_9MUSC